MRLIDLTLEITQELAALALGDEFKSLPGHLGTHFDVMNKTFPLDYTQRSGIVFDVSAFTDREINCEDFDLKAIPEHAFVAFYTGFIERAGYGSESYRHAHPQLSFELINALLAKDVSIIGIDFAGVRRGKEHTPTDQLCADRGTFVVENLCNLGELLDGVSSRTFLAHTYPMRFAGQSGLPCRIVAQIE